MSVNKVILIGYLGGDPELREVGETSVANFNIATTETWKDSKTGEPKSLTTWVRIAAWRGLASVAKNYLKKGSQIYIEGRLRDSSYTDKDGNKKSAFEVVADEIRLLDRKESSTNHNQEFNAPSVTPSIAKESEGYKMDYEDDLPF